MGDFKISYECGDIIDELLDEISINDPNTPVCVISRIIDGYSVYTDYLLERDLPEVAGTNAEISKDEFVTTVTLSRALEIFLEQNSIF